MTRRPLVLATALVLGSLVLAACSTPPAFDAVRGEVVDDADRVLGVGLYFLDQSAMMLAGDDVAPSVVYQPEGPGFYAGELGTIQADGSFVMPLPLASDVPASALVPAEASLANLEDAVDCALEADDPTARVIFHAFSLFSTPGVYAATFGEGAIQTFVSDAPIDLDAATEEEALGNRKLITWLYATKPVALATTGVGCDELTVDLALVAGWNQVAWQLNADLSVVDLVNDATAVVVVTPLPAPEF